MKKLFPYLFICTIIVFASCKNESVNPQHIFKDKIKTIHIHTTNLNDIDYTYKFKYDSLSKDLKRIELYSKINTPDTTLLVTYMDVSHDNNIVTFHKTEFFSDRIYRIINAHIQNNIITQLNYVDTITKAESPYFACFYDNKLDSVYEPNQYPTALNRRCYDYIFDGNNYSQFTFEYDYASLLGGSLTHIEDTAIITYTNITFNKYAPIQNMYSSSTLSHLGATIENITDNIYLLGFQDHFLYPHNQNLVKSIHTVHNNSTVFFNYVFNCNNQLVETIINYPNSTSQFLIYEMEYY